MLVYAADADPQFHGPCRDWLERQRARPDAWYTTWGSSTSFDTTHPRVMRRAWNAPAAWEFVIALLASPGRAVLVPTQRHSDVAGQIISELPHLTGNLLHDAHTAILMREHGIGESAPGTPISITFRSSSDRSASTKLKFDRVMNVKASRANDLNLVSNKTSHPAD